MAIEWTQGKALDAYTSQLLASLGQRGIPYRAIRIYVPVGPGTSAYWDYNLFFKNNQGLPTGVLVGPYAMRDGEGQPGYDAANILDMALGKTIQEYEQLDKRDWSTTYTYNVHLGPFGLYGELRPNNIPGSGTYGGYATPPSTFGTAPAILPPPMVEQPKPAPPAPVVQDLSGATTPSSAGINVLPGTGYAPPAPPPVTAPPATGMAALFAGMDKDTLIQLLLKLLAGK